MTNQKILTVICRYTAKAGKESELEKLLSIHWPALHKLGLVTDEPSRFYRGMQSEKPDGPVGGESVYVEIFSWKSAEIPATAHEIPEVMAVWGPIFEVCDAMEFPHFQELDLLKS